MNPPTEITPAVFGMVVIILLQLAQFFFSYRKNLRADDSAWKEDVADLKVQLSSLRSSFETKMESARIESSRSRNDLYIQINGNALKTAGLVESTETLKQSVISLTNKVDLLRVTQPHPINGGRKIS